MVFIKHNSLKSGIFFNPKLIPGFSGPRIFRVQVFQGLGFSRSESRVQGPGSTVQVQGPGPGFRSSPLKSIKRKKLRLFLKENVQLIFFCAWLLLETFQCFLMNVRQPQKRYLTTASERKKYESQNYVNLRNILK